MVAFACSPAAWNRTAHYSPDGESKLKVNLETFGAMQQRHEIDPENECTITMKSGVPSTTLELFDHPGFFSQGIEVTKLCFQKTMQEYYMDPATGSELANLGWSQS